MPVLSIMSGFWIAIDFIDANSLVYMDNHDIVLTPANGWLIDGSINLLTQNFNLVLPHGSALILSYIS